MSDKGAVQSRLDQVLELSTQAARGELGDAADNKQVSAKATLSVAVTESGTTKNKAVNAGVSLGVSSCECEAEAACPCGQCPHECDLPAFEKPPAAS